MTARPNFKSFLLRKKAPSPATAQVEDPSPPPYTSPSHLSSPPLPSYPSPFSLQLGIDGHTVKWSILAHPRIKLREEHVRAVAVDKVRGGGRVWWGDLEGSMGKSASYYGGAPKTFPPPSPLSPHPFIFLPPSGVGHRLRREPAGAAVQPGAIAASAAKGAGGGKCEPTRYSSPPNGGAHPLPPPLCPPITPPPSYLHLPPHICSWDS